MPDEQKLETATNMAVTLAWAAGAVAAVYLLGVIVTWVLTRISRRSDLIRDIEVLTRRPVRAAMMVLAASIAVRRTTDAADSWRNWVDHTLLILMIAAVTWLLTGLVRVAERRMISRYGGGGEEISDADRRWRRVRTQ
jgi:hypothetical protein